MSVDSIVLNGNNFNLKVIHKPISGLRLRLSSPDEFTITCSPLTPKFVIHKFITAHTDWIIKHSSKLIPKIKINHLDELSILDVNYKIIKNKTARDSIIINEIEQIIYLNFTLETEDYIKTIFEKRLKRLALNLIKAELQSISSQFDFKYNRVCVKNQSSRFGSCSSLGNLNFNWQIVLFPVDKFRHILFHELTHLKIKNHQSEFWHQLSLYDPNWHHNNLWLKKTGRNLLIFS